MREREERSLDRLLGGRTGPSVGEREAMLDTILAGSRPRRALWRWRPILLPAAAAASIGAVAVVVALQLGRPPARPEMVARGGANGVALRVACVPPRGEAGAVECQHGDTLAIAARPPAGLSYLSVAALGPDGLLISYFPGPAEPSRLIPADGVMSRGVSIGDEHAPGRYRIFGFFSARPLSEAEVREAVERQATSGDAAFPAVVSSFEVRR